MILKGNQRGGGTPLALHLLNTEDNEHVEIHDLRGFAADDLRGAFKEIYAISKGTKCQQFLFSLSLNPPQTESVPVDIFEDAINRIEQKMGLGDQPRAIVFHEKEGRRHAHCVWSRIDVAGMKAINLSHYKLKLRDISRQLFLEQGWQIPKGLIDPDDRDTLNFDQTECQQAKRIKQDPQALKQIFLFCWQSSDSLAAFASALRQHGFILAKGDRRGHMAVDRYGEVYAISRWVGIKAKDARARLGDLDSLPTVSEAHALLLQSLADVRSEGLSEDFSESLSESLDDHTDHQEKIQQLQLDELSKKRLTLVERHRQVRRALYQAQAERRIKEIKKCTARLPKGLKALWSGMTGQYQKIADENAAFMKGCAQRDREERQTLIEQQLRERRALQREILMRRHQEALANDIHRRDIGRALRIDPAQPFIPPVEEEELNLKARIRKSPEQILEVITNHDEFFTRNDILRGLGKYIDDPAEMLSAVAKVFQSKELVGIENPINTDTKSGAASTLVYSTREMQALKTSLNQYTQSMSRVRHHGIPASICENVINRQNKHLNKTIDATLSQEQCSAIRHVLGKEQLSVVVGLAGAGKSTLLDAAREGWLQQGKRVIGAALSGKAADGLEQSSGIESRTLASWRQSWKNGYHTLKPGDVMVIDEAGMVGTKQMVAFMETIKQQGAKLVLVGDPEQLQPINAGTPLKEIANQVGAVELTEIRRQKTDWQRKASRDFAQKRTKEAIQAYADHGAVYEAESQDEAITALVEDYMCDLESNRQASTRLALAHRRADVHKINQAIRSVRQVSGDLNNEQLFKTRTGPRAFAAGDRIVFTRNNTDLGIRNGSLGTVKSIGDNQLTIILDQDGKNTSRTMTFSPKQYPHFDHGYATTIHTSQGATVDRTFVLSSNRVDRHLTYVAMTRHRHDTKLYVDRSSRFRFYDKEKLSPQQGWNRQNSQRPTL